MRRKKRWFTILVIPHNEEHVFSFKLPLLAVQALAAFFILVMISFLVLINQYRTVLNEAAEARHLREANRAQQQVIDRFAEETRSLLDQMGEVENLAELVAAKLGLSVGEEEDAGEEGEEEKTVAE